MLAVPDGVPQRKVISANIQSPSGSRTFWFFDTPLGRTVLQEVVGGKSYPILPFVKDVQTIVDIGANVGTASVFFALHYPQARILAFEPSPDSFSLLEKNLAGLPGARAFACGLYNCDKQVPLFQGHQDSVTNSIGESALNTGASVQVELRDALSMMFSQQVSQIDILKVDTEGAELPILQSLAPLLPAVQVLYLEYHDEDARLEIDRLITPGHVLYSAKIEAPHRGELCYVRRDRLPAEALYSRWRIRA